MIYIKINWHSLACLMLYRHPWVLVRRFRSSSDGRQPSPDVSTLNNDMLQSTTRRIPTSSTDRLGGAISIRMTVLLLFPVFLLLSCVLFLTTSTRIALGTLCSRPLLEIATRSILYPCSLLFQALPFIFSIFFHGTVSSIYRL